MFSGARKIVIASSNPGKLREIEKILAPLGIETLPQSAFSIPDAGEPYATFVENALAKARHASRLAKFPTLADDSGICVDALDGAPGVRSARYAGEPKSDERNNSKLIASLRGIENRGAHYVCVMTLLRTPDDPRPVIAEAEWHGEIAHQPRGSGGFGYDPLFLIPPLGKTGAEIPLDEKNRISHRGRALAMLVEKLLARE